MTQKTPVSFHESYLKFLGEFFEAFGSSISFSECHLLLILVLFKEGRSFCKHRLKLLAVTTPIQQELSCLIVVRNVVGSGLMG